MSDHRKGIFIISLDFELNWGVHDVFAPGQYEENLTGTRKAIDELLDLFKIYQIPATWATVGMLFFSSKKKLLDYIPEDQPTYRNMNFSPYEKLEEIGNNEMEDPFHYGASILQKIKTYPRQEIATHTFSHYYCLEQGQTSQQFEADLKTAILVGNKENRPVKSIVFPRNQVRDEYVEICKAHGLKSYRGNPKSWIYRESSFHKESALKRVLRLADSYLNLTGHHSYSVEEVESKEIINLPGSRFLRPYSKQLKYFEKLKLNRIKKSIHYAATRGEIYHLWWHPHNFGKDTEENIVFLEEILKFVVALEKTYGFKRMTMEEASQSILQESEPLEKTQRNYTFV